MANKPTSRRKPADESAAEPAYVVQKSHQVLNLAAMRAERSRNRPTIVDQDGIEHDLGGLTLDAYLSMLEIEEDFARMAQAEADGSVSRERQVAMIKRMQDTVLAVLPNFPVAGLYLDELSAVAQAIQVAVLPGGMRGPTDAGDGAERDSGEDPK